MLPSMPKGEIVENIVFIDFKGVHGWQRNSQGYDGKTNSVKEKGSDDMA